MTEVLPRLEGDYDSTAPAAGQRTGDAAPADEAAGSTPRALRRGKVTAPSP